MSGKVVPSHDFEGTIVEGERAEEMRVTARNLFPGQESVVILVDEGACHLRWLVVTPDIVVDLGPHHGGYPPKFMLDLTPDTVATICLRGKEEKSVFVDFSRPQ